MANVDSPKGFKPAVGAPYFPPTKWGLTASETIAVGDMVYVTSAGRVSIATSSTSGYILGVAATSCSSATVDDPIYVWDNPNQLFEGQCSGSGALADPYTCHTAASCFDLEGTTGIQEINEDATTYDIIQVVGVAKDPVTGVDSAVGANQRKVFKINWTKHAFGIGA